MIEKQNPSGGERLDATNCCNNAVIVSGLVQKINPENVIATLIVAVFGVTVFLIATALVAVAGVIL